MKQLRWCWTLFFFWSCFALEASEKLCLWKCSGDQNTVYLLGSIHFLKKSYYPLPEPFEDSFSKAETVAFETDMAKLNSPENQLKMMSLGICPEGKSLRDYLSPETYAAVKGFLKEQTILFDRFRPWMAAVALVTLEIQKLGFDPEQGIDQYFFRRATRAGKKCEGLETVEFQLGLFTELAEQDQEEFLKQTLGEIQQIKKEFDAIAESWASGDTEKLAEELRASLNEYPKLERRFLTDRNKSWIPKIEEYLKGPTDVLVVVGAAHLVGKDSVVELLKKKGHQVEQVSKQAATVP